MSNYISRYSNSLIGKFKIKSTKTIFLSDMDNKLFKIETIFLGSVSDEKEQRLPIWPLSPRMQIKFLHLLLTGSWGSKSTHAVLVEVFPLAPAKDNGEGDCSCFAYRCGYYSY